MVATHKSSSCAREFLAALQTTGVPFTLESVVASDWPAAVDFWLYELNIFLQMDGHQHFCLDMHGNPALEQQAKDCDFNTLCWEAGLRVVRVHFWDACRALPLVSRAMRLVKRYPRCRFVLFSESYRQLCPSLHESVDLRVGEALSPIKKRQKAFSDCIRRAFGC